jgi:hypothetical protein
MAQQENVFGKRCENWHGSRIASGPGVSHEPPTPANWDVAELLDVHMQQRTGVIVFVATDRLPGTNADVLQAV